MKSESYKLTDPRLERVTFRTPIDLFAAGIHDNEAVERWRSWEWRWAARNGCIQVVTEFPERPKALHGRLASPHIVQIVVPVYRQRDLVRLDPLFDFKAHRRIEFLLEEPISKNKMFWPGGDPGSTLDVYIDTIHPAAGPDWVYELVNYGVRTATRLILAPHIAEWLPVLKQIRKTRNVSEYPCAQILVDKEPGPFLRPLVHDLKVEHEPPAWMRGFERPSAALSESKDVGSDAK